MIDPDYANEGTTLEFIDGKTEIVYIPGSNAVIEIEDEESSSYIKHGPLGYFIKTVPFSLRRTTKATLNGQKIVTKDVLNSTEKSILSKCVPSGAVETNSD